MTLHALPFTPPSKTAEYVVYAFGSADIKKGGWQRISSHQRRAEATSAAKRLFADHAFEKIEVHEISNREAASATLQNICLVLKAKKGKPMLPLWIALVLGAASLSTALLLLLS